MAKKIPTRVPLTLTVSLCLPASMSLPLSSICASLYGGSYAPRRDTCRHRQTSARKFGKLRRLNVAGLQQGNAQERLLPRLCLFCPSGRKSSDALGQQAELRRLTWDASDKHSLWVHQERDVAQPTAFISSERLRSEQLPRFFSGSNPTQLSGSAGAPP